MNQQIYHGVDLIEIERIAHTVNRYGKRFLERIYTAAELEYAAGRPESLAARWAAKEAAAKLLGVGLRGIGAGSENQCIGWHEAVVTRSFEGRPLLQLHGRAALYAAERGISSFALSLSHTRTIAIASIIGFVA